MLWPPVISCCGQGEHCGWSLLQAKLEVQKLINKAQDGALEAQPGRSIMESFEAQVTLPKYTG